MLVIDDDPDMCAVLADGLRRRGYDVGWRSDAIAGLELALRDALDVIITDIHMRELSGLELCQKLCAARPSVPVLVITAFGSLETAVAAIRAGAYDFITKPLELDAVAIALARAVQHHALGEEIRRLRDVVSATANAGRSAFLGDSAPMQQLRGLVERVAPSAATVLVVGESGTGKELVARAIHRASGRPADRFVALNCASMPDTLIESELFGHVRGAFTDARSDRDGLLVEADGGTLLLDEVGELAMPTQAKLLRVLQERMVRPVGSNRETRVDVRIVAATNRDLEARVEEGNFREDLLYRLNVVQLDVPPLRVRGNDVLLLAQHFLAEAAERASKTVKGLSRPVANALLAYRWPGNVRELQNCIERAVIMTAHDTLVLDDLPAKLQQVVLGTAATEDPTEFVTMDEVERRYILRVLDAVRGNRTMAAKILGFDRRTITRKLRAYGLGPGSDDGG
ncbi:MAG TPA: sigma-54 dependent transcriptional regulator [Nannocystaceae bacterium]|nr:sigma-54 dependent transcriptional regulator [Nannocystaceae bacterium]